MEIFLISVFLPFQLLFEDFSLFIVTLLRLPAHQWRHSLHISSQRSPANLACIVTSTLLLCTLLLIAIGEQPWLNTLVEYMFEPSYRYSFNTTDDDLKIRWCHMTSLRSLHICQTQETRFDLRRPHADDPFDHHSNLLNDVTYFPSRVEPFLKFIKTNMSRLNLLSK